MAHEEVIPIPSAEFSEKEETVLQELYSVSDGSYNLYALAWRVYPQVQVGTAAAEEAFKDVRNTVEQLIARGIVRGKRLTGADGIYFDELKLTAKGERKAIESKNRPRQVVIHNVMADESDE
jgi:hypothetical protein